jgi:hypothetical protein
LIFVAVVALLLDAGWLALYAAGRAVLGAKYFTATYMPQAEMLVSFLWTVLWLAASVSFAAQVPQANDTIGALHARGGGGGKDRP